MANHGQHSHDNDHSHEPDSLEGITLGEVFRTLEGVGEKVDSVDEKVEDIRKQGLPKRVKNLETWRDRALMGLAALAMAGGAFFGIGL